MSGAAGDERSRLVRALGLSRRFHLYVARCKSPRAADQLVKALREELPRLRKAEVALVRLDPYAGRATDAPLTDRELADSVLLPLLSPPDNLRDHGTIHVVDASRAPHGDVQAWGRFFALWNEKRNALQEHGGEVLVLVPETLATVFATSAPDVWSIRSGEYAVVGEVPVGAPISSAEAGPRVDLARSLRGIPLLALFGGDLVVRPWVMEFLLAPLAHALVDEQRSLEGADLSIIAQRNRRMAEMALAERRFGEAELRFRDLLRRIDGAKFDGVSEVEALALSGLCVALAAQDRAGEAVGYGERALSLVDAEPLSGEVGGRFDRTPRNRVLGANALVRWCVGHLQHAAELTPLSPGDPGPHVLRLVELGRIKSAIEASRPLEMGGVMAADLAMLIGDIDAAYRSLEPVLVGELVIAEQLSITIHSLICLARGDFTRAAHVLASAYEHFLSLKYYEGPSRAEVMHAYARAILAAELRASDASRVWLRRAKGSIPKWGRYGLDRRSRLRALVTIDFGLTMLEESPEQGLARARELTGKAMALLGDTAEDHIARVLAVKAFAELARRLPAGEDRDAATRQALDLAQPLAGLGVPAWDELSQAAA